MGQYTEQLKKAGYEISPEDDNYTEKLLAVAQFFRDFDEALDFFIVKHGYNENVADINKKVRFIRRKFREAGISPIPRNLKKWFTEKKRIEKRKIAFQFCFAFQLDLQESEDFFRTVCLQRGFDCHYIEEAIYYYAIANRLSYKEAMELIDQAPGDVKGKVDFDDEILFTEAITREINKIKSKEALIQFFYDNVEQFGYNNATAYKYIMDVWNKIRKPDGCAEKERQLMFPEYSDGKQKDQVAKTRSVWDIYLQIMGFYDFDYDDSPLFVLNKDRTLKPILKNNALLHPLAENSFPDRQGLEAILRGEHKSNELVRKTIILLVFYYFWTNAIEKKGIHYQADYNDGERCYAEINHYLADSGYPTLYAGNPYDWIFLYAMQDEFPMDTFRSFMRELYIMKEDEVGAEGLFES